MSAKTNPARRAAFLRALEQTGNYALAAERARVSRSWPFRLRAADPEFDAACLEAVALAGMMLADDAARQPADRRWRYQDGEELVVNGAGRKRIQVRRAKLLQWTPRVEQRFLSALAATCNVRLACRAVGMWPPSAYSHRKRFPAFARAWDEAVAIGMMKLEAALIENIDFAFDPETPPPELTVREVTIMDLIRTLRMYEKRERGRSLD